MTASVPQTAIVSWYPNAVFPWPRKFTRSSVNIFTTSAAAIAQINRQDARLVRSRVSPVITPDNAQYGMLLAA